MARSLMHRRGSIFAALALIAAVTAAVLWWLPDTTPRPAPAANFTLLDGSTRTLAQLKGRPVLVAFWSLSCAPCLEELPDLAALYREQRTNGFELIAVAMPYDPPAAVQAFAAAQGIPYPVALDVEAKVVRAFDGVPYIPMAFLISPAGDIVYQQSGKLDIARVHRIIQGFARR